MAEITAWLDDEALDRYLDTVEALLDGYIEAMEQGTPADKARERVESDIFDADPYALRLLTEIEIRALDAGLVPRRI